MNQTGTVFGQALADALALKGFSLRGLARETGMSYEHARRLARGIALPSPMALRSLCRVLALDETEMAKLVAGDEIRHRYGGIPYEIAGKNPELEPVERYWPQLSAAQKEIVLDLLKTMVRRNRAKEQDSSANS